MIPEFNGAFAEVFVVGQVLFVVNLGLNHELWINGPGLPKVDLSVSTNTASEAAQTVVTLTATASEPVQGNQTVNVDVSGLDITTGDYALSSTSITIPRSYFYLHEWAIGNGNSAIGLNAEVFLLEVSEAAPNGRYTNELQFVLSDPGMTRTDARSLPLFEMVSEATGRWTARLY